MKVSLDGHSAERKRTPNRLAHAQIEYVKINLPFGRVFEHYGLPWASNSTHQISCPFHGEDKNPSARFYHESRRIFCFACNEGWDVAAFVKKQEGHESYKQTLEFIAKEFGVGLSGADLNKRIDLEQKRTIESQVGKRKIFGDTYANKLNDHVHALKRLGPEVAEVVEKIVPKLFDRKTEIDYMHVSYIKYTQLIRHWAKWGEEVLSDAVKRVANENNLGQVLWK